MDDATTPVTAWLAFTLAFDASARHCQFIRQSQPCVKSLGNLIQQYMLFQDDALEHALVDVLDSADLQRLHGDDIARKIDHALHWRQRSPEHHLIGLDHPYYPSLLRDTEDAPPLLYAKGSIDALTAPKVAIVGSRKASLQAARHTRSIASKLAEPGIAIVSGLALGIDASAHEGALDVRGTTIAVAATEPESVYPKRHHALAQRIVDNNGLIVTEYPLGAPTLRWYFPRRNRIISGMCHGVLVAEAGLPSGTLTTATHAMNQGREVMAVPGSVHNPQARGCHALIKQGAALVETHKDVLDALGSELGRDLSAFQLSLNGINQPPETENVSDVEIAKSKSAGLSNMENAILLRLAQEPATTDDLMTQLQISVSELSTLLGLLEIKGHITSSSGGRYMRC